MLYKGSTRICVAYSHYIFVCCPRKTIVAAETSKKDGPTRFRLDEAVKFTNTASATGGSNLARRPPGTSVDQRRGNHS